MVIEGTFYELTCVGGNHTQGKGVSLEMACMDSWTKGHARKTGESRGRVIAF